MRALSAIKGGQPAQLSVLFSIDVYDLIEQNLIVPFDDAVSTDDERAWLKSFYPALMSNGQVNGKTWGIPFQRSTIVLYWNKDLFKEAGLDPDKAPATWAEQIEFAKKLTKADASGNTSQWGLQIPSSGFPYWLFQGLTTQAGAILMNSAGDKTNFDDPAVVDLVAVQMLETAAGFGNTAPLPPGLLASLGRKPGQKVLKAAVVLVPPVELAVLAQGHAGGTEQRQFSRSREQQVQG